MGPEIEEEEGVQEVGEIGPEIEEEEGIQEAGDLVQRIKGRSVVY